MAFGGLRSRFGRIDQLHAAGLAATTGMNLRLDHPLRAADPPRRVRRLRPVSRRLARRHRNAVAREQLLRLVFVQIHRGEALVIRAVDWRDRNERPRILEELAAMQRTPSTSSGLSPDAASRARDRLTSNGSRGLALSTRRWESRLVHEIILTQPAYPPRPTFAGACWRW